MHQFNFTKYIYLTKQIDEIKINKKQILTSNKLNKLS